MSEGLRPAMTESKVDVLRVMDAARLVQEHAVIAQTANGDIEAAKRAFGRIAEKLKDADAAASAVAKLIDAAKECEDSELAGMACLGSMAPCEDALGRLFAALAACTPAKSEGR